MSMPASNSSFFKFGKKHGRETADKYAKRKNDEYLDDDLAKVLEEKEKLEYRRERDRETAKEQSNAQPKRFKGKFGAGPSGSYRGGYVPRERGGRRPSLFHLCIY
jgi:hypothetical protein